MVSPEPARLMGPVRSARAVRGSRRPRGARPSRRIGLRRRHVRHNVGLDGCERDNRRNNDRQCDGRRVIEVLGQLRVNRRVRDGDGRRRNGSSRR